MPPLAELAAPTDPRAAWALPAFGSLPVRATLDDVTTRVVAPNPSPMTLDGTNTYLVGAPGHGGVLLVDPGPDDAGHLDAVRAALAERDAVVDLIVLTHHHRDHAEAAGPWSRALDAPVAAVRPGLTTGADPLVPGDELAVAGVTVTVVPTPGHAADHVAFRLPTGSLLVGDHVLGRGTSVVAHPDGNLAAYLGSLRRVLAIGPDVLLPGHGPALDRDPTAVVSYYLAHRAYREAQIVAVLAGGPATPAQLVARIYADVDPVLWPAAEASTRAALDKLADEGGVELRADGTARLHDR